MASLPPREFRSSAMARDETHHHDIIFGIILPFSARSRWAKGAARFGLFDEAANRGLSVFVFNFALPLICSAESRRRTCPRVCRGLPAVVFPRRVRRVSASAMLGARGSSAPARRARRARLGAGFSNTGMLGFRWSSPPTARPRRCALRADRLSQPDHAAADDRRERDRAGGKQSPASCSSARRSIATTPVNWGLSAGLAFALLGAVITRSLDAVVKSMGAAAAPCALFALGASLTRYRLAGNLREPMLMVVLKTIVHPLLVWLLARQVFDLPPLWATVAVTLAALPTGVTPYLFAQRYGASLETSASVVFLSTVVSVFTLSALLFLQRT